MVPRNKLYRKKPVVIEAIQWTGDNFEELKEWGAPIKQFYTDLIVGTLEDGPNQEVTHYASLNDWIIRGVKGEFYACKPDIFDATYEPA